MTLQPREHGGSDALGVPRFDFSTNSNACGPCPKALAAVTAADASRYPDPSYAELRSQLAQFHGVSGSRVVLAGSASEFIFRITAWVASQGVKKTGRTVCVPSHAYGDYAQAAQAWGFEASTLSTQAAKARLLWCCEPSSPLGGASECVAFSGNAPVVLDCAYAPLRLSGETSFSEVQRDQLWQMFSPNKALGLTGVRGAYAIAPQGGETAVLALEALAPSWPLGAHGVALLGAWALPETQSWLAESLRTLRRWKTMQVDMLQGEGWRCLPSDTNFFCAQPSADADFSAELARLRTAGIKLRDTTSFGLPGHARLSVQAPIAQNALKAALQNAVHQGMP